jgi:integrase
MDFMLHGQRIRESTGTRSKTLAQKIEDKRRREIEEGTAGVRRPKRPGLLSVAAEDWFEAKKPAWAPSTAVGERVNLDHLLPELGRKLIVDIDPKDVAQYQKKRLAEGASRKTINNEVGTLRGIMRRSGAWDRIRPEVSMLAPSEEIGRAITADEERALLEACSRSRSRSLLPFIVLTLETGARKTTVRTLKWRNIDFEARCLRFGKDKTAAGSGRLIPLNQRALGTLTFWAAQFPDRKPEHYVFATERYGLDGEAGYLAGRAVPYSVDPTKPMGSWKTAWNAARKVASTILKGDHDDTAAKPMSCRIHDLRHTAISRMLNAGTPIAKVAKIVGWSPSTMVKMAARYGHFTTEDLRDAMETISSGSPVFSPVHTDKTGAKVQ